MTAPVTAEVWNEANSAKVADLSTSTDGPLRASLQLRPNEPGTGSVEVLADNAGAASLTARRCVRIKEGGTHVGTFYVRRRREVVVGDIESAGEVVTASGPGLLGRLDDALVLPWVGAEKRPASRTRVFNYASPGLSTSSWNSTLHVQPRTTLLWGDDRPVGWLDPFSVWIWGAASASTHAAGDNYFRRTFTLAADALFAIYTSFDDAIELWLDGTQILKQDNSAEWDNWWWTWRAPLQLSAGTHTIAAKVTNGAATGPGGFLLSGWTATEQGGIDDLVILTGTPAAEPVGTWVCRAYPSTPPGWTAGAILRVLIEEAQARGALTGWTLDFSDSVDSNGTAWPVIAEWSIGVGRSVLDAVRELSETWIDVDVGLSGLQLRAWDKTTGRGSASGVTLAEASNVSSLVREVAA